MELALQFSMNTSGGTGSIVSAVVCFSTLESVHGQTTVIAEFAECFHRLISIFDRLLPLSEKNGIQKKNSYIQHRVQVIKALGSGCSCRDVVLNFGCGKLQIFGIKSKEVIFTAKFMCICTYLIFFLY